MALTVGGALARRRARLRVAAGDAASRRLLAHLLPGRAARSRSPASTPTSAPTWRRACGTTSSSPATAASSRTLWPVGRARHRLRRLLAAARRRARLVGRPRRDPGQLRAADRVLLGLLQPALRHRLRRASSATSDPDWELAAGRLRARHRPQAGRLSRQGRVRHGLVLPGAGRALDPGDGLGAHRRAVGRVRDRATGACGACRTGRG